MVNEQNNKQVTAIVPAFNEGKRLGRVLEVLTKYSGFAEVIVVDDGSTDDTAEVASKYPVTFISNPANQGKARAMDLGVAQAKTEIIFFSDADIFGLDSSMLDEIINPVVSEEVEMFIAMRNRKIFIINRLLSIVPLLGGERALTKTLWQKIPKFFKERFRIEAALNFYAKYYGRGLGVKIFRHLDQIIKEKKYGVLAGIKGRISMIADVVVAIVRLQWQYLPKNITTIRLLLLGMFSSLMLVLFGLFLIVAVEVGPLKFIFDFFAEELREDINAPFIKFLIYLITFIGGRTLLYVSYLIVFANLLAILAQADRLLFRLKNSKQTLLGVVSKTKLR